MSTLCLFIENQRERQVVQIICESYGYNVISLPMEPASFNQLLQYRPETIIMEIPESNGFHNSFLRQIRAESRTSKIRILGYGDLTSGETIRKLTETARISYYGRPLTTDKIRQIARPKNGKAPDLRKEVTESYAGELDDTAKIMDPETPRSERITIMAEKIGELLAFPFTVAKVLAVTQSSTTGAADLARAIEIDPVIVSAILKTANSALYGRAGAKISSIKDAIVRIGFTETKSIAVSLSVMMLFSDEENSIGFDRKAFWYHSLAVGVIAARLARQAGFPRHELAFVGGLLHDFGIILLDEFYPTFFTTTLRTATQNSRQFLQEQEVRWKMTHNDVVSRLFTKWNMPEELLAPIQYWHKDFSWKHETDQNITTLVHSIRVAEIMAHSLSVGKECDEFIEAIPQEVAESLKLNRLNEELFFKAINADMNLFTTYLQMAQLELSTSRDIPKDKRNGIINYVDLASQKFDPLEYYLISHEYQLLYYQTPEDISSIQTMPDLLLFRVDENCKLETIIPFTQIWKAEDDKNPQPEPTAIPVLITGPASARAIFADLPKHCGFLVDTFDLRVLTFSIQRLILGEPLTPPETTHANVPSVTTATEKSSNEENPSVKQSGRPTITPRILDQNKIVLQIKGTVSGLVLPEIKDLIGKFLQKTNIIIFDFTDASCPAEIMKILNDFRKILLAKNVTLVLCTIGAQQEKGVAELLSFSDDTDLLTYLNKNNSIA